MLAVSRELCLCRRLVDIHKGEGSSSCEQGEGVNNPDFPVDVING